MSDGGWQPTSVWTLFRKEIRRFAKVWLQTILSPLVTTSLYFLVFGVALGSRLRTIDGVPYIEYVVPGLIMLAMISNSFLNSASSLFQSKVNGTVVDLLSAPLGPAEVVGAYVVAAVLRGCAVGLMVWLVAAGFIGPKIASLGWTVAFAVLVCATFGAFGLVVAIWAEKFDQLAIVPNFVLTPLTFLGGVFYSVDMLPEPWSTVSRANPILYMVNGLRHGMLGRSDLDPLSALAAVGGLCAAVLFGAWWVVRSGWRLRS
jgi:ABC-2 type transport system permease protein